MEQKCNCKGCTCKKGVKLHVETISITKDTSVQAAFENLLERNLDILSDVLRESYREAYGVPLGEFGANQIGSILTRKLIG